MIAQIGPLVQAGRHTRKLLIGHIVGGAVGGALTGVGVGIAGVALGEVGGANIFATPLCASLGIAGLIDLQLIRFTPPIARQTPRGWTCALGKGPGVFAWGVDLGLGVATRLPAMTFVSLLIATAMTGSFPVAVGIMALFGFVRAAIVVLIVLGSSSRWADASAALASRASSVRHATGVAALLLGVGTALTTLNL